MELTQVEGFGVGLFWRNVVLDSSIITGCYEPKGHLGGRGERNKDCPSQRDYFYNYF